MSKTISESKSSNMMILLIVYLLNVYLLMNDATDVICYKNYYDQKIKAALFVKIQFIRAVAIDKTIMIKNKSGTLIEKFD